MAAIDNKHLIEILTIIPEGGISKQSGKPWQMWKAQCVIKGPDNSIKVGVLNVSEKMKDTPPGKYLAEFELGVNFENKVIPLLTALHPHGDTASKPSGKGGVQ